MANLIELNNERAALVAALEAAKAEMAAKIEAVEAEMRKAREATLTLKVGDLIETRRGPVKLARFYVHPDCVSAYVYRKTPGGRWSKKTHPLYDWDFAPGTAPEWVKSLKDYDND